MDTGMVLLAVGGLVLTVGDVLMKRWVDADAVPMYWAGMAAYVVGVNFLAHSFRYRNIAVASVMFVFFNVVTLAVVSWACFGEPLSRRELAGMGLGLASIALMECG
jgi:multidrug transporter EmrE-like cation transporter